MKQKYLLHLLIIICFNAYSQTVMLTPSKDNSIFENATNNSNGIGPQLFSGNTCAASPRRALMQFDFSSIPAGATITSVELTLNVNQITLSAPAVDNHTLHRVTTEWGEGNSNTGVGTGTNAQAPDATWLNAMFGTTSWTTQGGDFIATPSATTSFPAGTGNVTFNTSQGLVDDVQGWVDGTNSNYGWALLGNESRNCAARRIGSRENTGNEPTLAVTYSMSTCTEADIPTVTNTSGTICSGDAATLSISGNLNDATMWYVFTGSCGGTLVDSTATGSISVSPTTTTSYFIRGNGGCTTPGMCGTVEVPVSTVSITNLAVVDPTCNGDTDGSITITATGGTGSLTYSIDNGVTFH